MAKQGINPLEQHVEKIVVGLAVLLFALVVFNYVISTPILVSVANQTIPPTELDRKLGEVADQVAGRYRSAVWNPPQGQTDAGPQVKKANEAKATLEKVPAPMVSPVRWGPEMPPPPKEGAFTEGKHGLATVGVPLITGAYTGVTYAGLVVQPASLADQPAGNSASAVPAVLNNQDVVWAFLRLNFDMQEQYDIFRQNGYSPEQANLILFLDIQAQRQQVYPDGSTGAWEDVKAYRTVQPTWPQGVEIRPDGTLPHGDEQAMLQLFGGIAQVQQSLLYPLPEIRGGDPFPPYFKDGVPQLMAENAPTAAPVAAPLKPTPRPTPGPRSSGGRRGGEGGPGGPGGPGGGARESRESRGGPDERGPRESRGPSSPGGPAVAPDKTAMLAGNEAIQEAKKAFNEKRYQQASQALSKAHGIPALQRQVAELEMQINAALAKWQEEEAKVATRKATAEARNAEIWLYDLQAPAGKTYRYRARVLLLNVYSHPISDRVGELRDPKLGSQVALTGEWSTPSDPINLADSRYFFFTAGTPEKELASVDVFRFQLGRWFKDSQRSLAIGDAIGDIKTINTATGRLDVDYRTGHVVVDIGNDAAATIGQDNKGAKVGIQKRSSAMLISMDADGVVQPRWAAIDKGCQMYKELDARVKATADSSTPVATTGLPR